MSPIQRATITSEGCGARCPSLEVVQGGYLPAAAAAAAQRPTRRSTRTAERPTDRAASSRPRLRRPGRLESCRLLMLIPSSAHFW